MTVFDKIRQRNSFVSKLVKLQNTAFYPALLAIICVISATNGKEVYLPCMWIITAITVFTGLFTDDLKIFIAPAFMGCFTIGMDVSDKYFSTMATAHQPPFDLSSGWQIILCALIIVAVLVYKLISFGYIKEMLIKRGIFFWGIICIDIALITNGLFSPEWSITTLLFGLMLAVALTLFYMLFITLLSHSRDGIAFACKTLVFLGLAVVAQVAIIAYKLHLNDYLFVYGKLNRHMLSLAWGPATVAGAVVVMAIVAAIYLMHSRKMPLLSFAAAVFFWVFTVLIDSRAAILFGAAVIFIGLIACCFSGRNKKVNRGLAIFSVSSVVLLVLYLVLLHPDGLSHTLDRIMDILRFDLDFDSPSNINSFFSSRLTLWEDGFSDFLSAPVFGTGFMYGFATPSLASSNLFENMYHNFFIQLLGSMGVVGVFMMLIHFKHILEVAIRRFSTEKFILLLIPIVILGMSMVDNFFFYPSFMAFYACFLAAAELTLEKNRQKVLDNLKTLDPDRKPRVVFTYVEAGKGHIIPTRSTCDEFKKYYGDKCEVIESKFFTETGDPNLEKTEVLFRKAVQNQNRSPLLSWGCKLGNLIGGDTFALYALLKLSRSGIKTNPRAVKHVAELDADIIYSAHWSIPFYVNQLKGKRPYTFCFCPDVYSNGAFNVDCNNFLISKDVGYDQINRSRMYAGGNITQIPYPMRPQTAAYKPQEVKDACREKYGIAKDAFVVALCDGGYGMARLEGTVKQLIKTAKKPITLLALCGTNHELYLSLDKLSKTTPAHVQLIAVDFTDKMLEYLACADLFSGKGGANAIAEPASMGIPIIITKCITYIEKGTKKYYVNKLHGALYIPSCRRAAKKILEFADNPELLKPLRDNLNDDSEKTYNAKASADLIWQRICEIREKQAQNGN